MNSSHYEVCSIKLGDLLTQVKNPTIIKKDGIYKLVTISNTGEIKRRRDEIGSNIKAKSLNVIRAGQFIYSRLAAHTGSYGLVPNELDFGVVSNEMPCFYINETRVLPEYLINVIRLKSFSEKLRVLTKGMGRVRIKEEQFLNVEIDIHRSISTQNNLIKRFTIINKISDILSHEISKQDFYLIQLRQSILQDAIEGKLTKKWRENNSDLISGENHASVLLEKIKNEKVEMIREGKIKNQKPLLEISEEKIPFKLPDGWVWCRIGDICHFITKGTTPPSHELKSFGDIPYLKVYNIVNQKINFSYRTQFINKEIHKKLYRSKVLPGDVLMNIVGPPLGKVAIVPNDYFEWNINQALAIFRPIIKEMNLFIYLYLLLGLEIKKIHTLGVVGQDNISLEQCRNIFFPLIPLEEQKKLTEKIYNLLAINDKLKEEAKIGNIYLDDLQNCLLNDMFNKK